MKEEYDFRNAVKNPYAKTAKKQVTMNLNESTVAYFKEIASESGITYQTLINPYLDECGNKNESWSLFKKHTKWQQARK